MAAARTVGQTDAVAMVLVVEDDVALAGLYAQGLTTAGHRAVVAADGETGVAVATHVQFDVVLLDMRLPGISGMEFLRELVDREKPPIVIVVSAYSDPEWVTSALSLGASSWMVKGEFTPSQLAARVQEWAAAA